MRQYLLAVEFWIGMGIYGNLDSHREVLLQNTYIIYGGGPNDWALGFPQNRQFLGFPSNCELEAQTVAQALVKPRSS